MKPLWMLLRCLPKPWWSMLLALLLAWLTGAAGQGLLAASAWLIATAALHPSITVLSLAIVGVRFFGIARAVCRYGERYVSHDATFRILAYLRVWLYQRIEPLAPFHLGAQSAASLLDRLVGDVEVLKDLFLRAFLPPATAFFSCMAFAVFSWFFVGPWPGMVVLGAYFAAAVVLPVWLGRSWRRGAEAVAEERECLQTAAGDLLGGLGELWAFRQTRKQAQRLGEAAQRLAIAQRRQSLLSGAGETFGMAVGYGALWLLLWGGIPLVQSGQWSGVDLSVLALSVLALGEFFLLMPAAARYLADGAAAAERIWETAVRQGPGKGESVCVGGKLEVRNLSFSYADKLAPTLQEISFSLEAGKSVAVVGASGAGKSTLVSLLLGFRQATAGTISLGNAVVDACCEESWRSHFAVVPQRPYFFHLSLADNLRLARPEASLEELGRVLAQTQMLSWLEAEPQGWERSVGEGGSSLSGGQRQRLAIARALLKEAPYWLLDEATAGLDAVTAQEIVALLRMVTVDKGVLWITHHLQGLEAVDEILVLQQGRVVERGCMAELLSKQGAFYRMWTAEREACI
nr:thiol reductant ABC exporter subunit CydC [uncultured Anaeromusa sp.]